LSSCVGRVKRTDDFTVIETKEKHYLRPNRKTSNLIIKPKAHLQAAFPIPIKFCNKCSGEKSSSKG
jgi:hypothetical protein